MKKFCLVLSILFTIHSFAQEKVLLRLKFDKGDTYTSNIKTYQKIGDKAETNMVMFFIMEVLGVENGVYDIKATFPQIIMDVTAEGKTVHYDSRQNEAEMDEMAKSMHDRMKSVTETTINLKINERGETLSAKVFGEEEEFNYQDTGNSITYPLEEVSIGSTWKETKGTAGLDVNYEYEVTSIDSDKVGIKLTGTMAGLEGTSLNGSGFVNRANGSLESFTMDMVMDMFGQKMETKVNAITEKK